MKTNLLRIKILRQVLIFSLSLVICFSCSEEDGLEKQLIEEEEAEQINQELMQLQSFSQPDEISTPELLKEDDPIRDNEFECIVKKYKAAPGYDEMMILDPTSDVIYPGAMLKGESIPTGEYIGINGGRAPITLSVSLENIDGTSSVEIEKPELSEVRNGVSSLLKQGVTGSTPAELSFTVEEVYSEEHLDIALGSNYRSRSKDISASFDFESSKYKYRYVVMFLQEYYTIDLDLPTNAEPGSLFTELPNLNGTSPVIVSSVKYGRMVLYTVESDYETTDVRSAFYLSFKQGKTDGEIDTEVDYNKIISSSKIEALVIGGSAEDAVGVIEGPSGVYNYIKNGGNYSADSPGKPLAYTLRYIKEDFPIARVVLSSEYQVRTCDLAYPQFKITIKQIARTGGTAEKEIYGNIKGRIRMGKDNKGKYIYHDDEVVWDVNNKNAVEVNPKTPKSINRSVVIELYKPNYKTFEIYLSSHLYDYNGFGFYDDLGSDNQAIDLEDIEVLSTPLYVNVDDDGESTDKLDPYTHALDAFEDKMKVTFTVERVQ